jgi:glucokinase
MAYYLGLDIGGTYLKAGLVDEAGTILRQMKAPTKGQVRSAGEIVAEAKRLLDELRKDTPGEIASLGVGSPGVVAHGRRIVRAYNLPFDDVDIASMFEKIICLPTAVGNDANVAALAESRYGAGKGKKSVLLVTLGTGVGGGLIIDDSIYAGFNGTGLEIGHLVLVAGGVPCSCGRNGCIESYISATALIRQTIEAGERDPGSKLGRLVRSGANITGRTAFKLAEDKDPAALKVVQKYIGYVGIALANYINAYLPEILLIGGGISHAGPAFIDAAAKIALDEAFVFPEVGYPKITAAALGNDAGIVGAALIGKENCLSR